MKHYCKRVRGETAAEHHRRCNPFCTRVQFCAECVNVFGLCKRHQSDPGKTITWRRSAQRGDGGT